MKFSKESPKNGTFNMKDLEGIKDDIIITTPKEWYYPYGYFNTYRILQKWAYAFSNASERGKRGLRSFVDGIAVFYRRS